MKTVFCNNHLCGKEYNVLFDNCPFCGTPNTINETDRKKIANEEVAEKLNGEEKNNQFNGIVIGLIWISIFFFGIRGIITSFANMMFAPGVGCLTLALSIIGIVSLFFILRAKKWALFMWMAYRLAAGIVNGLISTKFDFATNIFIAIANIGLMVLVLQIKKNGVSAWSLIFKKDKSFANNIMPYKTEGGFGNYTSNQQFGNGNIEILNTKEEHVVAQENDKVGNMKESHPINCTVVKQNDENNTAETIFHTRRDGGQDEAKEQNAKDYLNKYVHNRNTISIKWNCVIIGLVVAVVSFGIWLLAKPNTEITSIEQVDSLSTETFDCSLFSFEYPKTFKTTSIQNAPHMVLKLESEDYFITASYWDYGIDEDVSIWNDDIFEYYRQMPINDGDLVDISKESIKTGNGLRHCLRIMSNCHKCVDGDIIHMKMLSYLMIHNGYLFNFTFGSEGEYLKGSSTSYPDSIMCGLCIKSNEEKHCAEINKNLTPDNNTTSLPNNANQQIHNEMIRMAQNYNKDLPENIGLGMTMIRCAIENQTLVYTIQWNGMISSDFSAEDIVELKNAFVEGLKEEIQESPSTKAMLNVMKEYGYGFVYRYVNERGQRLCSIRVSPSEI